LTRTLLRVAFARRELQWSARDSAAASFTYSTGCSSRGESCTKPPGGLGARPDQAPVIRWFNMPRLRRPSPSEFPTERLESVQAEPAATRRRSVRDPVKFFRAIAEIERLRGLRVHPESPTLH
jgi:hypothetical protein